MKRVVLSLLAVSIIALLITIWQKPQQLPQADSNEAAFFPKYDAKQIVRVEVEQLLEGVQLKKNGETWQVAPFVSQLKKDLYQKEQRQLPELVWASADSSRVNAALGMIGGLERGLLVSRNPEKQVIYQVGKQGLELRFFNEKNELVGALVVGKNGPDFASTYVRRSDESDVYLTNQSLLGVFSIAVDDWVLKPENASTDAPATLQAAPKK